jgi:type I restriction enzyme S subunit
MNINVPWDTKPLKVIAEIHDADRIPIKKSERVSGNIPYCGANGIIDSVEGFTHDGDFVMLAEDGGRFGAGESSTYLMSGKFWANNHVHVLRGKPGILNSYYLHYVLNFMDLTPFLTGATRPKLTQRAMKKIPVPIPYPSDPARSLAEQQRIVARLEALLGEVREMRELQSQIEADVGRLMDAAHEESYPDEHGNLTAGWALLTFPDVCEINPRKPRIEREADVPTSFVPMAAVDEVTGSITAMETRPYEEVESGYRYFEEGDVLFAKITPSMQNGKAAIARNLIDDFGLGSTEFHVLRPESDILPEWIYHYIRRTKFRNEAMQRFRGAAGQQRVPKDFLENHVIPVPYPEEPERSLAVQQQMVAHFEAVKQETIEMLKLSKENEDRLDVLEQAILAQAFRGEV